MVAVGDCFSATEFTATGIFLNYPCAFDSFYSLGSPSLTYHYIGTSEWHKWGMTYAGECWQAGYWTCPGVFNNHPNGAPTADACCSPYCPIHYHDWTGDEGWAVDYVYGCRYDGPTFSGMFYGNDIVAYADSIGSTYSLSFTFSSVDMNQVNIIVYSGRAANQSVNRGAGLYAFEVYSPDIYSDVAGSLN